MSRQQAADDPCVRSGEPWCVHSKCRIFKDIWKLLGFTGPEIFLVGAHTIFFFLPIRGLNSVTIQWNLIKERILLCCWCVFFFNISLTIVSIVEIEL